MSFIGNVPAESYSPVVKDTFSGNDSTTDFTLSIPATTNSVEVFVENVQQEPTDAYTISGTTLSFTAAPVTGTDNIYVIHRGPAVQTVVPPAGVVIDASSITASGDISTEGDLKVEVSSGGIYTITGTDTSSNRTLTLPDEAGTVLTSASPIPVANLDSAVGITEADQYRITQDFSLANGAVLNNYWERVDSDGFEKIGTGVSESAGVFTLPSTGYWLIYLTWTGRRTTAATDWLGMILQYTADNSNWYTAIEVLAGNDVNHRASGSGIHIAKITDTSNQKFRFLMETAAGSGTEFFGGTDRTKTGATFIRLGDT